MENASKALLMAAGVLMGVLILSLATYLFATFKSQANENYELMRAEEIQQFNSFYLEYDGRDDLTYYDMWTIFNKANDYNYQNEGVYIVVSYSGDINTVSGKIKINSINQLKDATDGGEIEEVEVTKEDGTTEKIKQLKKYRCKVILDNVSGKVNEIIFRAR